MEPERWGEAERLCLLALEREESERAAFLEEACGGDEALLREVESLLAQEKQAKSFLEVPAVEVAAKVLAQEQGPSVKSALASDRAATEDVTGHYSPDTIPSSRLQTDDKRKAGNLARLDLGFARGSGLAGSLEIQELLRRRLREIMGT